VNGYEVARRIRTQPWGKRTYLVALSGWGQADERQRTKNAGFHAHLVKPVAPEAISRLLEVMTGSPTDTALT
jgi:CheY-like chemotaxis protein